MAGYMKAHRLLRLVLATALASPLLLAFGCSSIETTIDCNAICSRYADCYDKKYDVGACETRCKDKAGKDSEYKNDVGVCEACIDDRSCSDQVFKCGANCSGIVP